MWGFWNVSKKSTSGGKTSCEIGNTQNTIKTWSPAAISYLYAWNHKSLLKSRPIGISGALERVWRMPDTTHTFQVAKAECFMFHTKSVTKVGIEWYLFALSLSLYARRGADKRPRRRHSEIHAPCNRIGAWLTNFTACIVLIPNISNLAPLIACNPAERSGARHRVHACNGAKWQKKRLSKRVLRVFPTPGEKPLGGWISIGWAALPVTNITARIQPFQIVIVRMRRAYVCNSSAASLKW